MRGSDKSELPGIIQLGLSNLKLSFVVSFMVLISSCAPSIYTHVTLPEGVTYQQPTVVLVADSVSHGFMSEMKKNLELRFSKNGVKAQILIPSMIRNQATVLGQTTLDSITNSTAIAEGSDLLIIINPTHTSTYTPDGYETIWSTSDRLVNLMFQIVAMEVKSKERVWTAALEISSENNYYPGYGFTAFDGTGRAAPSTGFWGGGPEPAPPPPSILNDTDKTSRIIVGKIFADKVIAFSR